MRFADGVLEYIYDRRVNQQESLEVIAADLNISGALAYELFFYVRSLKDGSLQIRNPKPISESELVTLDHLKNGCVDKRAYPFKRPDPTNESQEQTEMSDGDIVWKKSQRRWLRAGYEEDIVRLYTKEALTVSDIVVKLNLPKSFINKILRKNNVSFRKTKNCVRRKDKRIVLERARNGESLKDIAVDLGYSFNAVSKMVEKSAPNWQEDSEYNTAAQDV